MSTEDNKKLSRRFLEELWNQRNLSIIDELLADTYVDHTPSLDPSDEGPQGPEALKQVFEALRQHFSDIRVSIESQIAEGDRVMNQVTWECTLKSDDPSTASQAIVMGVGIDRIDRGKIVENWNVLDVPHRLLNLLERDAETSPENVPPPPRHGPAGAPHRVPCGPGGRCPPGYICLSGICQPG